MHSSRADWVLGEARLISSPSTMLAKIAPGLNSKSRCSWLKTLTPVTSVGSRSGVNWMPAEGAIDRAGDGLGEHRLAHARHVFDQQVSLGDQGDQGEADLRVLAAHDLLDVVLDLVEALRRSAASLVGVPDFHDHLRGNAPIVRHFGGNRIRRRSRRTIRAYGRSRPRVCPGCRDGDETRWERDDGSAASADAPRGPYSQLQASRATDPSPRPEITPL